jgi:hypothetical protein
MQEIIPEINIDDKKCGYLYTIGDIHLGSPNFSKDAEKKLRGYINFIEETPNARCFLMGDVFDTCTLTSKSDPFTSTMTLNQAEKYAKKLFWPIRKKIIGGIKGNHENRLIKLARYSPVESLCENLNTPYYGTSVVLRFNLGLNKNGGSGGVQSHRVCYYGYFHHMTGGGGTPGGKFNRVFKMASIMEDMDFYCGAHVHQLGHFIDRVGRPNRIKGTVEMVKRAFILTGGFLDYRNSYAEEAMLSPTKLGSPRIRMDAGSNHDHTKDLHINS